MLPSAADGHLPEIQDAIFVPLLFNPLQISGCVPSWTLQDTRITHFTHFISNQDIMYPSLLLAGALLPFRLMAHPSAAGEVESRGAISRPQHCSIVGGSETVKCREGPGTKYDVRRTLHRGDAYDFWCVLSKECVTIGGSTNWYVLPKYLPFFGLAFSLTATTKWMALHPSGEMLCEWTLHLERMYQGYVPLLSSIIAS